MLKNEFSKALPYVNVAMKQPDIDNQILGLLLYSKARIEAFTNKNTEALQTLEKFLVGNYNWFYILNQDEAFTKLRKDSGWNKLMQAHPFVNIYDLPQ
ncbi:MAG: hypothetical protein ABI784_10040 [Ginsengibacter sp.]